MMVMTKPMRPVMALTMNLFWSEIWSSTTPATMAPTFPASKGVQLIRTLSSLSRLMPNENDNSSLSGAHCQALRAIALQIGVGRLHYHHTFKVPGKGKQQ